MTEREALHVPVLREEVLAWLQPKCGGIYVDATLGLGGHTLALLDRIGSAGRVIGFEWDEEAAAQAGVRLQSAGDRVVILRASYTALLKELERLGIETIDGLVADFGVSSLQLDQPERGFSFKTDAVLDMRMDTSGPVTAAMLVNQLSAEQLADIFYHYGEEWQARRVARWLVEARQQEPVETTARLAAIVAAAIPRKYHPEKVHVATKVFQALRIAVNKEMANVRDLLTAAPAVLTKGGRIAAITFHSLEDRVVKQALSSNPMLKNVTKRPIVPSREELLRNPRARSAKLRVVERC